MCGRHDLAGLHGPMRREAGGCTHVEDEFGESMLLPEQNPGAIGELFELYRAATSREGVGPLHDDDELFPTEADDGSFPLWGAWADGDVPDAIFYRVIEGSTVLVLAQHDRRTGVPGVPELECGG
jgi:hypothetical protein